MRLGDDGGNHWAPRKGLQIGYRDAERDRRPPARQSQGEQPHKTIAGGAICVQEDFPVLVLAHSINPWGRATEWAVVRRALGRLAGSGVYERARRYLFGQFLHIACSFQVNQKIVQRRA